MAHASRVKTLYKLILRLHRGLPEELQAIGNQYVREEFKLHKNCEANFVPVFMNEWTNYAITLAKQIGKKTKTQSLGIDLTENQLNSFSDNQIEQLHTILQETKSFNSTDPDPSMGVKS